MSSSIDSPEQAVVAVKEESGGNDSGGGAPPRQLITRENVARAALPITWAAMIAVFGILRPDTFLTTGNLTSILGSQAVIVVLTVALVITLTAGDYDLSIAYNVALTAMVLTVLDVRTDLPTWICILGALGAGAVMGAINGTIVVGFNVNSLIATLGTGTIAAGVTGWISGSTVITGLSPSIVDATFTNRFFGIPLAFYYGLAVCVVVGYMLEYTTMGRRLLIVGRNRSVARLSGIRVGRVRWLGFVAGGCVGAIAGIIYAGTLGGADPSAGPSFLLPGFAAAFLSATTISPGRFNVWGSVLAAYFLVTGITGLQLLGAPGFVQNLFYGGALVIAVVMSQALRRGTAGDVEA